MKTLRNEFVSQRPKTSRESSNIHSKNKKIKSVMQNSGEKVRNNGRTKVKNKDNTDDTHTTVLAEYQQSEIVPIAEENDQTAVLTIMDVENTGNVEELQTNLMINPELEHENTESVQNSGVRLEVIDMSSVIEESKHVQTTVSNAEATTYENEEISAENIINIDDETRARMPELRAHDSQENVEKEPVFSIDSSQSPLENVNERETKTGQSEKTFSQFENVAEKTVSNAEISAEEAHLSLSESFKAQQFHATQQMTQTSLSTPVSTENLFQEMVSRIEMMQNDTKNTMTIQLNPEWMGKVTLEVSMDAVGLHVKINAEDNTIRGMISSQLSTLIESLENKGIEVVKVDVVHAGIDNGALKDDGESGQRQTGEHKSTDRKISSADDMAHNVSLSDLLDYYLATGVSSVQYTV